MGVGLGHGAHLGLVANVVAQHGVEHPKVGGGAVGEVAHHHAVRLATVLVHHHQVGVVVTPARLHQLGHYLLDTGG